MSEQAINEIPVERPKPRFAWPALLAVFGAVIIGGVGLLMYEKHMKEEGMWPTGHRKDNMQNMAAALEAYRADWGTYPPTVPLRDFVFRPKLVQATNGWEMKTMPPVLTTPTAYIEKLLGDPHAPEWNLPFAYYTDGEGWIMVSTGRDHDYDLQDLKAVYYAGMETPTEGLLQETYDPTNGKKSSGDVWLTSEGLYSLQEYQN